MGNKCPSCSARIDLNPITQTWDCSSCGSKFTLDQMQSFNQTSMSPVAASNNGMVQQPISTEPTMVNTNQQAMVPNTIPQPMNSVPIGQPVPQQTVNSTPVEQPVPQQTVNSTPVEQAVATTPVTPVATTPSLEKETIMRNFDQYHCNTCGTEFMADANTSATFCIYCGITSLQKERIEEGKAPNLIIPFKKTKSDVAKAFSKLLSFKPLTPGVFRTIKKTSKIIGVYVPFWAYDITCDGNISFHCADSEKWMDENYRYIKNSKFDTTMFAHLDYQKVLSKASSHFKDELMASLEPFNFDELVDYNHAYLSNYFAEKYDITEDDAYIQANEYTMNQCVEMSTKEVGHQHCEINQNNLYLSKKSANCIMLPVYLVQVKYKNKDYTFAMNGQSGKVIGDLPVGLIESIVCTIVVFVVLVGVAYLLSILGR